MHTQNLPAGWLAVGPSRFHVILGFGDPSFQPAPSHQSQIPRKIHRSRQQWDESELKKNIQTQNGPHKGETTDR